MSSRTLYTPDELEGLDRLHEDQKQKGWIRLKGIEDVNRVMRRRRGREVRLSFTLR